jgi:hypothetical protein
MEKKEKTRRTVWLVVGIIVIIIILLRIFIPLLKVVHPDI